MEQIRLGRTNLMVGRSGFGAIPIQRISFQDTEGLLQRAYENGINFFDTARGYTDSKEKIGNALSNIRKNIIIATKSPGEDREIILRELDTPGLLKEMLMDYQEFYIRHEA